MTKVAIWRQREAAAIETARRSVPVFDAAVDVGLPVGASSHALSMYNVGRSAAANRRLIAIGVRQRRRSKRPVAR